MACPSIALALQGGGSHGAFSWGVIDRLMDEVEAGRLEIAAISGASAGAINATITAAALQEGGPALVRERLAAFWRSLSLSGSLLGNGLFGFGEPGPFGWNIDASPGAIALEAIGLVVSPYNNPFYEDPLAPLLEQALPPERLARLNGGGAPQLFLSAVDTTSNGRHIFRQPDISIDTLRASACLPSDFRSVIIDGVPYWDGGYLGNPALAPLIDAHVADDILLVMVNALTRKDMPPRSARAILERLNEIGFNASVVLELNAIAAVNGLLEELKASGIEYRGKYRPISLHLIRDDAFMASLGFVSKSSTSWALLSALHIEGQKVADQFIRACGGQIGQCSSVDVKTVLTGPVLNAG